ncbi:hypothetical protein BBW65_02610 [Helicobacter enhydrae]|uniref:TonB C-terminal domain-containing protein n=1 Tax=Helicobacter enhydrae TaxID=222136 RepID=A0A1B1U4S8_9HELI|nr:TonB family protein [Helicobacter enhydrae]ANV97760.1 hypothetical protein BBW65_02610 [Helicobacter enhydrae]
MTQYRLIITCSLSLLLHLALIALFLHNSKELGFKKGVGDERINASSFRFSDANAQAKYAKNAQPQTQKSSSHLQKQVTKTKPQKNHNPQNQTTPNHPLQQTSTNQDKPQEDSLPPTPTYQASEAPPIEETLAFQLADTQTKQNISQFYGADFGQLGFEEKEFILNNLSYIGKITQRYLRYPPNAGMLAQSGGNVIEFYLHPNGDISDLKIIKESGYILLDRNSIKTIEIAYKDYPHPKTKTLIRFYINYYLRRH